MSWGPNHSKDPTSQPHSMCDRARAAIGHHTNKKLSITIRNVKIRTNYLHSSISEYMRLMSDNQRYYKC